MPIGVAVAEKVRERVFIEQYRKRAVVKSGRVAEVVLNLKVCAPGLDSHSLDTRSGLLINYFPFDFVTHIYSFRMDDLVLSSKLQGLSQRRDSPRLSGTLN